MSEDHEHIPYGAGQELTCTIRDLPPPDDFLPNGQHKLPVAIAGRFIVMILNSPSTLEVGQNVKVRLVKVANTKRGEMGFGAIVS